jgi:hypothetical protein
MRHDLGSWEPRRLGAEVLPLNLFRNGGRTMQCPVCNVPLTMSERQGVEIDYCPKCRGVWLDRGELDKIIARNASEAPSSASNGEWRQPPPANQPQHAQQQAPQQGWHGQDGQPHPQKRRRSFLENLFD